MKAGILILILMLVKISFLTAQPTTGFINPDSTTIPPGKQKFLWFIGKWDTVQKKFIIDASSGGGTVSIGANGKPVIQNPANDNWNKTIDDNIDKVDKAEQKLEEDVRNQTDGINWGALMELAKSNEKEDADTMKHYKVPENQDNENDQARKNTEKTNQYIQDACSQNGIWRKTLNDMKAYYDKWKPWTRMSQSERPHMTDPPVYDPECAVCHPEKWEKYKKESDAYTEKFFEEENNIIRPYLEMISRLSSLGYGEAAYELFGDELTGQKVDDPFRHVLNKPSLEGPCGDLSYLLVKSPGYYRFIFQVALEKADQLRYQVKKEKRWFSCLPLSRVSLSIARDAATTGLLDQASETDILQQVAYFNGMMADSLYHDISHGLINNDVKQVAKLLVYLDCVRADYVCGGPDKTDDYLYIIKQLYYDLNIDIDVKLGDEQVYYIHHLKSRSELMVMPDTNTCVRWVVSQKYDTYLPFEIITNEQVSPKVHMTYVGTRKYHASFSGFTYGHYCKYNETDSLMFGIISADPFSNGLWEVASSPPINYGIGNAQSYFTSIDKAKEKAGEFKQKAPEIQAELEKQLQTVKQMQSSGQMDYTQAYKLYQMAQANPYLLSTAAAGLGGGTCLEVKTGQPVKGPLFKQTFDAKLINPDLAKEIVYGYLRVDLTHKSEK